MVEEGRWTIEEKDYMLITLLPSHLITGVCRLISSLVFHLRHTWPPPHPTAFGSTGLKRVSSSQPISCTESGIRPIMNCLHPHFINPRLKWMMDSKTRRHCCSSPQTCDPTSFPKPKCETKEARLLLYRYTCSNSVNRGMHRSFCTSYNCQPIYKQDRTKALDSLFSNQLLCVFTICAYTCTYNTSNSLYIDTIQCVYVKQKNKGKD